MELQFNERFVGPILAGTKKLTIREDKERRWKAGSKVDFSINVRTPQQKQFMSGICTDVTDVVLYRCPNNGVGIVADSRPLSPKEVETWMLQDGQTKEEFIEWFFKDGREAFFGRAIFFEKAND